MYKQLFQKCKSLLPRISETELLALKSGTTSLDRQIFEGKVFYPKKNEITPYFQDDTKIHNLLKKYGQIKNVYPDGPYKQIFEYIGKEKFFSFIIHEKYGVIPLSVSELSSVLCKVSSKILPLEFLLWYPIHWDLLNYLNITVPKNKRTLFTKIMNGEYIPCFGLTGPHNGSDATGSIDSGTVIFEKEEKYIDLNINKRYITLGPIANLIGIAFNLQDPYDLLDKGKPGITVALIEKDHPGLEQLTHHNPLNVGFPNGTLKGKL